MSATPETDRVLTEIFDRKGELSTATAPKELVEKSRDLERRLAASEAAAAAMRQALEEIGGYALSVRLDKSRHRVIDGDEMQLQTLDWCQGLIDLANKAEEALATDAGKALLAELERLRSQVKLPRPSDQDAINALRIDRDRIMDEAAKLKREHDAYVERQAAIARKLYEATHEKGYWTWQDDEAENHLESLTCMILIRPDQLREIMSKQTVDNLEFKLDEMTRDRDKWKSDYEKRTVHHNACVEQRDEARAEVERYKATRDETDRLAKRPLDAMKACVQAQLELARLRGSVLAALEQLEASAAPFDAATVGLRRALGLPEAPSSAILQQMSDAKTL